MSIQNYLLKKYLRYVYKPRLNGKLALEDARMELDQVISSYMPPPSNAVDVRQVWYGGIDCECITPKVKPSQGTFFFIHGGIFAMGSALSHRGVTMVLADRLGLTLLVPNYRLSPEYPCPAAIEDVVSAYLSMMEIQGDSEPIYVGGDQVGACLAFQLLRILRERSKPMPEALVGISGLYDLGLNAPSLKTNALSDCCLTRDVFVRGLNYYLADSQDPMSPDLSPLYSDMSGFPPVLLQVSDSEVLLDDSKRMAKALTAARVPVCLDIWKGLPPSWHLGAVGLPEGKEAIDRIGEFIAELRCK